MKKRLIIIVGLMAVAIIFAGALEVQATRVTFLGFDAADSDWFESTREKERILEDINLEFIDKLSDTGNYTVLSWRRTKEIMNQVNYDAGRRPTHSVINQLRTRSDSEYFLIGKVDNIDIYEKDQFNIGPVRFSEVEIIIDLSIEKINARTARTTDIFSGSGQMNHTGINIVDSKEEQIEIYSFDDNVPERAFSRAIVDLIADITGERVVEEVFEETVLAKVVSIVGDRLVIDKGSRDGLKVGQIGDIVRYSTTSADTQRMQNVGKAEISELDRNSGFASSSDLNLTPQKDDIIRFTVEEKTVTEKREVIKVIELRDFTIELYKAKLDGNRVTIEGVATSKRNNSNLEISLGARDFHDHNNNRLEMTGKRVSIGDWIRSSSDTARISDTLDRNDSKNISWSFSNVPTNANKISRVVLWLSTDYEGDKTIELSDLKL